MTHLSNNLITNFNWANIAYFIAGIIESYLVLTILLLIFDLKASHKQKALCIALMLATGEISSLLLPLPFNIILNYGCIAIFITIIFKIF